MTIQETIAYYKQNSEKCWESEKYKWIAVKHYKDNWNIDAEDFGGMVEEAFSLSSNLLAGGMYYAYKMVCAFAHFAPEKMRDLFKRLYNENLPLSERFQPFRAGCEEIRAEFQKSVPEHSKAFSHYQDLRAMCVYLSFEYPEKYFLFKYKMYVGYRKLVNYEELSQETDSEVCKYDNFARMCQSVVEEINKDEELKKIQHSLVESDLQCYSDPAYHFLAQTIVYVNSEIMDEKAKEKEAVADGDVEVTRYWIYSPGEGANRWKECLSQGIMFLGWDEIGDFSAYGSKDEMKQAMKESIDPTRSFTNAVHATWQFVHDMKPGDIVFAKKGMLKLVGRGVVESDYIFDPERKEYRSIRKVNWTHKGEWDHPGKAVTKTLTDITPYTDYVNTLNALFEGDEMDEDDEQEIVFPVYEAEDFLKDVYMDEDSYNTLVGLVRSKKNVILRVHPE